jgi:hypothetical protein
MMYLLVKKHLTTRIGNFIFKYDLRKRLRKAAFVF